MTDRPILLVVVGPPAVGKFAVGQEIARRTGMRLFHNHLAIEPVAPLFEFGSAPFVRLVDGFRRAIFEEVAASELPGLVFTYFWAFNLEREETTVAAYTAPFRAKGCRVLFLELQASLEERLRRNTTPMRLAEKPSKRDVARSERLLLQHEKEYVGNTTGERDGPDWLRIDNTHLSVADAASRAIDYFGLRVVETEPRVAAQRETPAVVGSEYLIMDPPWLTVRRDSLHLSNGLVGSRYVVEQPPWVNVVAITEDDEVVLVRQYRHGIRETHLEIPGGYADSADQLEDAKRELLEETGYSGGQWSELLTFAPNPALQDNWLHTYLAAGVALTASQQLDPQEELTVELHPVSEVMDLITRGSIVHALHIAPLLAALIELGRAHDPGNA